MAFRDRVRSALQAFAKEWTPGAVIYNTVAGTVPDAVVPDDTAMRCAAVHVRIRVLSENIALLPILLYRRNKEGGKKMPRRHLLCKLVYDRPGP